METATKYIVRDGDSFASIALTLWGDSSLWWMIADYNAMTSDSELAAGMTLRVPNEVHNLHYNSTTFRLSLPKTLSARNSTVAMVHAAKHGFGDDPAVRFYSSSVG